MSNAKPCLTLSGRGGVQVSIWKNRKGNNEWYSCKLARRFKREGSNEWATTDYLGDRDLLTAAALLEEAHRRLGIREFGPGLSAPAVSNEPTNTSDEDDQNTPF